MAGRSSKTPLLIFMMFVVVIVGWLAYTFIKLEKRPGKRTFAFKNLYGTMLNADFADNANVLDELKIDNGTLKGRIVLRNMNDVYAAELELESDEEVNGKIVFDSAKFNLFGTAHLNENFNSYILSAKNEVNMGNVGQNKYLILLREKADLEGSIDVAFYINDNELLKQSLKLKAE